ncbi:hypothetical protein, partial [Sinorhizobium meliloti]|uniref:hypothetical protein n=1 Tax=Rhizobium meliloti TaxID=382 RepID=UPI001AEC8F36
FSPGHRDLHRIFANPTESQLAEITQFFLRQPLREQAMAKNVLPPPPPGYKYIFRPWRKCARTGKVLWARTFGLKAWPILVLA